MYAQNAPDPGGEMRPTPVGLAPDPGGVSARPRWGISNDASELSFLFSCVRNAPDPGGVKQGEKRDPPVNAPDPGGVRADKDVRICSKMRPTPVG
jgi:hypothetical protein